jgi:hypothetical protein
LWHTRTAEKREVLGYMISVHVNANFLLYRNLLRASVFFAGCTKLVRNKFVFLNFEFEKTETGRGFGVVFERCASAVGSRKINIMAQLCGDCIVVGGVYCHLPFLLRRTKLTFDYFRNSDITSVFER